MELAYVAGYMVLFFINAVLCQLAIEKDNGILVFTYLAYMFIAAVALISLLVSIEFSRTFFIIGYISTFVIYIGCEVFKVKL